VLLFLFLTSSTGARSDDALRRCPEIENNADEATFLAFDRELRAALKAQDAGAISLLVRYPLRLNYPDRAVL
jgi:hypothetical protein